MHGTCKPRMKPAMRELRYLKNNPGQGLFFLHKTIYLCAFSVIQIGILPHLLANNGYCILNRHCCIVSIKLSYTLQLTHYFMKELDT